jgi:hypothetical protein
LTFFFPVTQSSSGRSCAPSNCCQKN